MNSKIFLLAIFSVSSAPVFAQDARSTDSYNLKLPDIRIRDPFIHAEGSTRTYYLYAQRGNRLGREGAGIGVEVYKSKDLIHWSRSLLVYRREEGFWGGNEIWAPEVHRMGKFFHLFVTLNGREGGRGKQIFRSESPEGPFQLFSEEANTPPRQRALDGTPWIGSDGRRWLIYCHEWVQIGDGAILAVPMKDDFSRRIGEPVTLFHASRAPWVKPLQGKAGKYVTDGPVPYRTRDGRLLMLWSSFTGDGRTYAVGIAESSTGHIDGKWSHFPEPLFAMNGGHCMVFRTFDGELKLVLHQPNSGGKERARLFSLEEKNGRLKLITQLEFRFWPFKTCASPRPCVPSRPQIFRCRRPPR